MELRKPEGGAVPQSFVISITRTAGGKPAAFRIDRCAIQPEPPAPAPAAANRAPRCTRTTLYRARGHLQIHRSVPHYIVIRTLRLRSRLYPTRTEPVRMLYGIDPRGRGPYRLPIRDRFPRAPPAARRPARSRGPRRVTRARGGPPAAAKSETSGLPARATADAIERTRRTGTRTAAHARSARAGAPHRRPPGAPDGPAAGFARRPAIGARERYPADYSRVPTDKSRRTRSPPRRRAAVRLCALDDARGVPYRNRTPSHRARGAASLSQTASFDLFT